ncbi:proteasome subunit beta [Acidipropionibacterium jensenii]|uniref:Proteasome subunit beta n=1 Tax=Acidipropionibacterium jensenii TaxID=1749 RepID=A0A3S4WV62_9ACTN|nr:proteasome subunit beta [Acidipropionibacterium jensenii]AZZ39451.1 proteasome subunit beta [Acidipropionibacterium jensenii]AZZ42137.1 proteasome subunit beta [Acidipropionibacterium jensenii]MDN5977234.1 proteasome subunit beta [Acidipropionibacterium jensenii]MDN5997151.1 proteasome subunit beta [Acidipropionibacterium jensenii]MDN6426955.1 proteasome subunit beta [Acidipropionibacterium jensenii]
MIQPWGTVLPAPYLAAGSDSFAEFTRQVSPDLLPPNTLDTSMPELLRHGTTIVALKYTSGVVVAGDRRATMGTLIAQRDIEKVVGADDTSVIGVAGAAGLAIEMVRLFQTELEHYEKIEGRPLSLDGRAARLSILVRSNMAMAVQGIAVIPVFAGWDVVRHLGRIFSYDGTGGRYEEHSFCTTGSGGIFAKATLKKLHRLDMDRDEAVQLAVRAIYDASDDDAATAGPDLARGIYPVVMVADEDGVTKISTENVALVAKRIVDEVTQSNESS